MKKSSGMRAGMRGGNQPAGGLGSRVVTEQKVRTGKPASGINPRAVPQIGVALGNKVTEAASTLNYRGEPWRDKAPISVPLGNQLVNNVGKGGPGAGRAIHKCGSQGELSPTPNAAGKDILGYYGPDTSNARNRR